MKAAPAVTPNLSARRPFIRPQRDATSNTDIFATHGGEATYEKCVPMHLHCKTNGR
jgi:hypothetical protein